MQQTKTENPNEYFELVQDIVPGGQYVNINGQNGLFIKLKKPIDRDVSFV